MLELHTFGGLELRTEAGERVEALAGRTKGLALLAYLAVEALRRAPPSASGATGEADTAKGAADGDEPTGQETPPEAADSSGGEVAEGAPSAAGRDRSGRRTLLGALAGIVVLGAAVAGAWQLLGGGGEAAPPAAGDRSVAVLPFEAIGTENPGPVAEGLHSDLLTRLSNVSGLKVISATSVDRYRDTDLPLPAIADSLGVTWVLEGDVQRAGDGIEVHAQLIDSRSDTYAWADTYRRELTADNLFELQGEITRRIARSLETELSPGERERIERHPTESLDAYRLYVEGRIHLDARTEEGLRRGRERFREALAQDSSYALAWSGLADARRLLVFYGHAPADSMLPQVWDAARRAVELDPELAEAHASLAGVHISRHEGIPALRHLWRAVDLKPSYAPSITGSAIFTRGSVSRSGSSSTCARRPNSTPGSPPVDSSLARVHWWIDGPGDTALNHARRSLELEPDYTAGHLVEGLIHSDAGRYEDAISALQDVLDRVPDGSSFWSRTVGVWGSPTRGWGIRPGPRRSSSA